MALPMEVMQPLLGFFDVSPQDMLILGIIAVLLYGKRLPEVGRSLGKGLAEFKKGLHDLGADLEHTPSTSSTRSISYADDVDDHISATAPKFAPPPAEAAAAQVAVAEPPAAPLTQ